MEPIEVRGNPPAIYAASIIALRRDSVLMVKRARPPAEGLWSFPGGRLEPGETPEQGARRELSEETGLVAEILVPLGSFAPVPEVSSIRLSVFAGVAPAGDPRAADDALAAEFVPFHSILLRRATRAAPGWIVKAILTLKAPELLSGRNRRERFPPIL